ncbi:hypothetical protein B6U91_00395 [Candidatus Pacearchaeota archaeon ex4484_71]|nr:MAG: hypothetical protein B6U91_00395 [Candidatus Pacearchaeota archaeon ex4484_71]
MEDQSGEEEYLQSQNVALRDLEERQRILKDRLILIGQNLIEMKEKNEEQLLELKKDFEKLNLEFQRMKSFIETVSSEFSSFAKKEDLEILRKQAKMFQPLEFVRKEDLEKLKKK